MSRKRINPINKKEKLGQAPKPEILKEIICNRCKEPSGWNSDQVTYLNGKKELFCKKCGNRCVRILSNNKFHIYDSEKIVEEFRKESQNKIIKVNRFPCPHFIEEGLIKLAKEIESSVKSHNNLHTYKAPIYNNREKYRTRFFTLRSHYWGNKKYMVSAPNFKCGDLKIWWYKNLGINMEMNKNVSKDDFYKIIDDCIVYLHKIEKNPSRIYAKL